ncbi:MAG: hypothetical protein ACT4OI_06305, partial [Methanobacteriota archaeon]
MPKLAWCAELRRSSDRIEVFHGPSVETAGTFFCDGAWSGAFGDGAFESAILAGTAGKATADGLLLATPNNILERIFLVKVADAVLASNSLAFLLARTHDDLDKRSLFHGSKFNSIVEGLDKCVRSIPTRNSRRVRIFYHANILVTPDLDVMEKPKRPVEEFRDFAHYQSFLQQTVRAIVANAADPHRRVRYRPIASISNGYDSPASAVLAGGAGCTEALTFREARPRRPPRPDRNDSGAEIASILGLKAASFDRLDYLKEPGFTEAENGGSPLAFAAWAGKLEERLLFTGFHGGRVWDRHAIVVGPDIARGDASGSTFTEFRLRVGFIHLAVPFIGCTNHSSIHRISNSPEMAPWRLMSGYDKPIPRRLVEEAGVPRNLFAKAKNAVDVVLKSEGLKAVMSPESLEDFQRYCEEHWTAWMAFKARAIAIVQFIHTRNQRLNRRVFLAVRRWSGLEVRLPNLVPRPLRVLTYG